MKSDATVLKHLNKALGNELVIEPNPVCFELS